MSKVYIVRGLGMGDDENAFENMGAFTTQAKAQSRIESLRKVDQDLDIETEYEIETLELE